MKNFSFNLQRFTYFLIAISLLVYIAIVGKSIMAPLIFAAFFAAMLKPLCQFFEKYIKHRVIAIILSFIVSLLPIASIVVLFGYQISSVAENAGPLVEKLKSGLYDLIHFFGRQFGWQAETTENILMEKLPGVLDAPIAFISESLSSTSAILAGLFLTAIFTFFFLLYRTSFKNFFIYQFDEETRKRAIKTLHQIEKVSRKYLSGLLMVIFILGILNSLGLWLIGLKHAIFWGFLGACLAIIPFIGTTVGGLFPFLYAVASSSSFWQPAAVVILYATIQSLEGNFITPKVVGGSIKINPMAAILAMIVGGSIWGIVGIILALPIVAIIRIMLLQIDVLKPFGEMLCDDIHEKDSIFKEQYDEDRFRILSMFKK